MTDPILTFTDAELARMTVWCAVCGGLESYAVHRPDYRMERVAWDIPGHTFQSRYGPMTELGAGMLAYNVRARRLATG